MSYIYSLYSCFGPFPQPLHPLFHHQTLESQHAPIIFAKSDQKPLFAKTSEFFEPILIHSATTCEDLHTPQLKPASKREIKANRRQVPKNRDQNFGWRNQNKDRNVISSILKGYIQFVVLGRGMTKLIEELSVKLKLENGVSSFYQFMIEQFPSRKSYIGLRYVQDILSKSIADSSIRQILAVTLKHYLVEHYPLSVVNSCRSKKKVRLALLKKARAITTALFSSR